MIPAGVGYNFQVLQGFVKNFAGDSTHFTINSWVCFISFCTEQVSL